MMSAVTEGKVDRKEGKRFKLVVRSAEEAVRVIREKLGEDARVLSVKQVGGEGLKRFISSPKLEVIAEVPSPDQQSNDANALTNASVEEAPSEAAEVGQVEAPAPPAIEEKPDGSAPTPSDDQNEAGSAGETARILSKAGFDPALLSEIQSWADWGKINELPLADGLKEITIGLSDRFRSTHLVPTTDKIALLGAPGVGKTTTLCKFLAHEVFMNKRTPHVLKVENGIPNPDDALRIFCEVVGVTLFREAGNLPEIGESSPLIWISRGFRSHM